MVLSDFVLKSESEETLAFILEGALCRKRWNLMEGSRMTMGPCLQLPETAGDIESRCYNRTRNCYSIMIREVKGDALCEASSELGQ